MTDSDPSFDGCSTPYIWLLLLVYFSAISTKMEPMLIIKFNQLDSYTLLFQKLTNQDHFLVNFIQ